MAGLMPTVRWGAPAGLGLGAGEGLEVTGLATLAWTGADVQIEVVLVPY